MLTLRRFVFAAAFAAALAALIPAPGARAAEPSAARTLFDAIDRERVAFSPVAQSWRGLQEGKDRWDDFSEGELDRQQAWRRGALERLASLGRQELSRKDRLDLRILQTDLQREADRDRFRRHLYLLTPLDGPHVDLPATLINAHEILLRADAESYLARLRGLATAFAQIRERETMRAREGLLPPAFVYAKIIADARGVVTGYPFAGAGQSPLYADFKAKLERTAVPAPERQALLGEAERALREQVGPAYAALIAMLRQHQRQATQDAGVWKMPGGAAYYAACLAEHTDTALSADQVHALGLRTVAALQADMLRLARQLGHRGDVRSFIAAMRADRRFYLPDTQAGRDAYLARSRAIVARYERQHHRLFLRPAGAPLEVRAVEAYREHGAAAAFYESPSADGKRPGRFYVNLQNMQERPLYQLAALTYHEALPGHHLQNARAMEQGEQPEFRKHVWFVAHGEGWALYAEGLPKEVGLYEDPIDEFGRLALSLHRAARLVVDTGLHARRWTRQQARRYLVANTALTTGDAAREVDRYIVAPGQATGYTIGQLKIQELRELAQTRLGTAFDLRRFHELLLEGGVMPLPVLEERVREWIAAGGR
jgi:uncharacterized protein (DUF885 family)